MQHYDKSTLTGSRIRERRQQLKMTQFVLAQSIRKSLTQICRYEQNSSDPTGEVLIALSKALGTTTDYLLGLSDEADKPIRESDLNPLEYRLLVAYRNDDLRAGIKVLVEKDDEPNTSLPR